MKKLLTGSVVGAFVFLMVMTVSVASAKVERVQGEWMLTAPQSIDFVCSGNTHEHTLDTVEMGDMGSFLGMGSKDTHSTTFWDIEGVIDGDKIVFTLVYNNHNSGYTLNGEGVIATDGSITGTTDGNCQEFMMGEGSAVRFEGNHGQYVKSQGDKKEAAQSRVGMPTQSNGHTE